MLYLRQPGLSGKWRISSGTQVMRKSVSNEEPLPAAYIGIDPSISNTGLCALSENGALIFCADCGQGRKGMSDIDRYIARASYLVSCLAPFTIRSIAWENYSFDSVHRAYSLAECNGIMKAAVYNLTGKAFCYVAPAALKKFATGNGHAGKEMMAARAHAECSALPENASTDICDAFFLAKYAFYMERPQDAIKLDRGNPCLRARLEMIKARQL